MPLIGCCVNMLAQPGDPAGLRRLPLLREAGCDYAELPLAQLMELDEESFSAVSKTLLSLGLPCGSCNNFFPASIRLTGRQVEWEQVGRYAKAALARAARLGAKVVVFGSAQARNLPEGFPVEAAMEQLARTLRMCADAAAGHGITIAIECLNRTESNLINRLREGLALMRLTNRPNVRMLADFYHLARERDSAQELLDMQALSQPGILAHVHLAEPEGRRFPSEDSRALREFLEAVVRSGYRGAYSIEAYAEEPRLALHNSLPLLRAWTAAPSGRPQ